MSKYPRGTWYEKSRDRWIARIVFEGKTYRHYAKTAEEAHDWYEQKSLELYGFDRFKKNVGEL